MDNKGKSSSYTDFNSSSANALSRNPLYEPPLYELVLKYKTWTPLPVPEQYKGEKDVVNE